MNYINKFLACAFALSLLNIDAAFCNENEDVYQSLLETHMANTLMLLKIRTSLLKIDKNSTDIKKLLMLRSIQQYK